METVWASNLRDALALAIETEEATQRARGQAGDSAKLAGWKDLRDKIDRREVTTLFLKLGEL